MPMKDSITRLLLLLLMPLLALAGILRAQETATLELPAATEAKADTPVAVKKPFLWKIEGEKTSYLYGTIHVPDERVLNLPDVVADAIDEADALYTEIPMDMSTQAKMYTLIMRTDGTTLKESLPADLYKRLDAVFREHGITLAMFNMNKTFVPLMTLQVLEIMKELASGKLPLDSMLYARAAAAGKEVGGIETVEEQIGVFDSLTEEETIKALGEALDMYDKHKAEGISVIQEMIEAYLEGELDPLMDLMAEYGDLDEPDNAAMLKRLLDDRNILMAERIGVLLKENPGKSYFFAVGAAHYHGETGVGTLLEKQGYKITRITE